MMSSELLDYVFWGPITAANNLNLCAIAKSYSLWDDGKVSKHRQTLRAHHPHNMKHNDSCILENVYYYD